MDKKLLEAKLGQLFYVISETENWTGLSAEQFSKNKMLVRACQRNLQLMVEFASDINGLIVLEQGKKSPGSYRESFSVVFDMDFGSKFSEEDKASLLESVDWRNDLIHEYEPAGKDGIFLAKIKTFLSSYKNYAGIIRKNFI